MTETYEDAFELRPRSSAVSDENSWLLMRTDAAKILMDCGWDFDAVVFALGPCPEAAPAAEPAETAAELEPQPEFLYDNTDFREMPGVLVGRRIGHLGADFASIYLDESRPR